MCFFQERNINTIVYSYYFFLMLSFTRHTILWGIFFKSWLFFLLRKSWRSWCEILVKLIFEAFAINKLKHCFVGNFSQLRQFASVDVGRKISISSWLFPSTKKKKPSKIIMSQEIVKQKGKIYKKKIPSCELHCYNDNKTSP